VAVSVGGSRESTGVSQRVSAFVLEMTGFASLSAALAWQ
jgi:hypothetical protein